MGRNTYVEHIAHVRHRARVPVTDGLVEGSGTLQLYIQGRMAESSERRDIQGDTQNGEEATQQEQQAGRDTYVEHAIHGRHRARVPGTDGLVEGSGSLQ